MATILVIDDDRSVIESFSELFKDRHQILKAYNGREASDLLSKRAVDLVFLDYRLPGENGIEVLRQIRRIDPEVDTVIITAHGSFETIIESISLGAYDYVEKPLDIDKIQLITRRALESRKMKKYVNVLQDEQIRTYDLTRIVGKSTAMQNVFKSIGRLVNNEVTVLITGESGTGKELIAKALHFNSKRRNEPFVAINCSGLSETLLNNELFGHDPQAYTGATSMKAGKFEAAGEGTVFLDEVGDMPLPIQAKFLRVLQEREFQRLGSLRTIRLKARIIAATNKDLQAEVKQGSFREDLYYRINVASIDVPALRERREDIHPLVEHFLRVASMKLNKNLRGISNEAMKILQSYDWPGNVRELENTILSLGINNQSGIIDISDIPQYMTLRNEEEGLFSAFIKAYIEHYGNEEGLLTHLHQACEKHLMLLLSETIPGKTSLAVKLGISRVTLNKKLAELKRRSL